MTNYIFNIPGRPKPQKQTQFNRKFGFAYDPSKKDSDWIKWQLQEQSKNYPELPLLNAVYVKAVFVFTPTKSTSKKKANLMLENKIKHTKKPDVDNVAYLSTNAMKGIIYKDDSQIFHLEVIKMYGEKDETLIQVSDYPELE